MAQEEIFYERSHITIQDRSSTNSSQTEEVQGTIRVGSKNNGFYLRFIPVDLQDAALDDWALIQANKSVVSFKNNNKETVTVQANPALKHHYYIDLNQIRSVRRYRLMHGIGTLTLTLKDEKVLPTMNFTMGGSQELLKLFKAILPLEKSPMDDRLSIVKDETEQQTVSAFDQMNLFDDSETLDRRYRRNHRGRSTIERFAKVANFVKDAVLGPHELISTNENPEGTLRPDIAAMMESFSNDLRESNKDGFEVIYKVDFKKLPEVNRSSPVTAKEWEKSFDKDGRLINVDHIRERIFRGGLESNSLRREVWKFLLKYYPWTSTREERLNLGKQKNAEYFTIKLQWKSMNEQQKQRNNLFRDRESLIEKDVIRTDRSHEYFHGDNNVHLELLHDVLMTYNMYNFDLGYVQGMNDLLSPILIVMDDEVDAFWCFVGLMDRMEQNFHMDQSHIKRQLSNLHTLLQFIDAELANYLVENNSSNMYFFFRWMLICFKREFSFDDVMYLWEVLWTDQICHNFELLVCLAILMSQKSVIMDSKYGFNEILKHINDLSLKVAVDPTLKSAEGLYILLKQHDETTPGLPQSISAIMFPRNVGKPSYDSDLDGGSTVSSSKSSRVPSPRPDEQKPDERKPRQRNLTESHSIDENDSAVVGDSQQS